MLEKAYRMAEKSTYLPSFLCYLAKAFASIDPAQALVIANQINAPALVVNWKFTALARIAGAFVFTNLEQSFEILNTIQDETDKRKAYESILKSCASIDQEKAASIIQRIRDLVEREENPHFMQWMWYHIADAYTLSNNIEKALELIQQVEANPTIMLSMDRNILVRRYLNIAQNYVKSNPSKAIFLLDKILLLDNSSKTKYEIAKVCIDLNLKKAKEMLDQLRSSKLKIHLLLSLAEKYKNIDKQVSVQFLEQAIPLVSRIKYKPRQCGFGCSNASDVRILAKIACCYASIDVNKARELARQAELKVEKVGFLPEESSDDFLGGFAEIQVIPSLAKAYLFIDPKYAIHLVNKHLTSHPRKAYVLLKLLKMLNSNLTYRNLEDSAKNLPGFL